MSWGPPVKDGGPLAINQREYFIRNGIFFGFPMCCCVWFADKWLHFRKHANENYRYLVGQDPNAQQGYIPCPPCLSKRLGVQVVIRDIKEKTYDIQ